MLSGRCLSVCPVCPVCLSLCVGVGPYCIQTVGQINMKLGVQAGFGLGPGHIVLDGDPTLPNKK